MAGWIVLWKAVFLAGTALFFGLAVWVTARGWSDVRRMFSAMSPSRKTGSTTRSSRARP